MSDSKTRTDVRLIEAGFPCHQVGAETQRERGASSALPPLYFLHVWWARRPLTPSRAAILGSLLPAGTDPDWFLRQLGIEKVQAIVNGESWILEDKLIERVRQGVTGQEIIKVDSVVARAIHQEQSARINYNKQIEYIVSQNPLLNEHHIIKRWRELSRPLPEPLPGEGELLVVERAAAEPAWFKGLMEIGKSIGLRVPNLYGYQRAYMHQPDYGNDGVTVFDPTAGGGSIPFEALRLGHRVIANDINPVAAVILFATLDYPARYGMDLLSDLKIWGKELIDVLNKQMDSLFPREFPLPQVEKRVLETHLRKCVELVKDYDQEQTTTYLYTRQVTCPHCSGEAPLLNTCWLSKEGEKWGVRIVTDGRKKGGKVQFETYRVKGSLGPEGEDPNFATVSGGVGTCVHCRQAISSDEIKAQARGGLPHGQWQDRLFCVCAVRYQPKLNKDGNPQRYQSGAKAGEIKTEKNTVFPTA